MSTFNEKDHPRVPKGNENGGEFTDKDTLVLKLIKENRSIILASIKEAFSVDENEALEILSEFQEYITSNTKINLNDLINSRQSGVDLKMLVNRFKRSYNSVSATVDLAVNELKKENIRIYNIKNAATTQSVYVLTEFGEIRISDHKQSMLNDKGSVKFEIYNKSDINSVVAELKKINSESKSNDIKIKIGTILKPKSDTLLSDIEILSISESAFTGKQATIRNLKSGKIYNQSFSLIKNLYI